MLCIWHQSYYCNYCLCAIMYYLYISAISIAPLVSLPFMTSKMAQLASLSIFSCHVLIWWSRNTEHYWTLVIKWFSVSKCYSYYIQFMLYAIIATLLQGYLWIKYPSISKWISYTFLWGIFLRDRLTSTLHRSDKEGRQP